MMHLAKHSSRLFPLLAASALLVASASAWPDQGPGQGPAPAPGKAVDLLKSAPFDRLTLVDGTVLDIEPVSPRPLPEPEVKKPKTLAEIEEFAKKAELKRKRRVNSDGFTKPDRGDEDEEDFLVIRTLSGGDTSDYKVKRASIKAIEYFEDMLLADGDRLIAAGNYLAAFERFQLVKGRQPAWAGLGDHVNKLLFEEGDSLLKDDNARGLQLLSDLHGRKPDYPALGDRLAASYAKRIDRQVAAGDFLQGRRLLRDLERVTPGHPEGKAARGRLLARAKALIDEAGRSTPADRVDRLAEAARIWPDSEGLEAAYSQAFRAEPTLTVAVTDLADPIGPFPRSQAAERVARLLYLPILDGDDESSVRGEVPGQLLAGLEVGELGRRIRINLKAGPTWTDGSRPASAVDVARSLADKALPASPGFDARWADLLERVEVADDRRVEVKLARSSLKPETWLLGPVGPAHAAGDGRIPSADGGHRPVGDGTFRWVASPPGATILRSTAPDPTGTSARVRRVREVRHPTPAAASEAFLRGEVSVLERVPPDRLAEFRKADDVKLGAYATPSVHRLALDGRTPALRNRKLRRALSLAIDRKGLLAEVVGRRPPDDRAFPADGPFVRGSFVDALDVAPLEYNPLLALGLVSAARKELGGNPIKLTMEYPSIPEARAACPKIAEGLALIGVEVRLVERPESRLEAELRSGRRFELAYRSPRPSMPFRDAGPSIVPGYDAPPSADALASSASPRVLQLLLQLDRAPDSVTARGIAMQVDRESRDELPVIPLWQLDDHYAWRGHVRGPLETADHLYRGLESWEVDPWYVRDAR